MTNEELLAATAVNLWNLGISRANKLFLQATPKELEHAVAPGKNRLIYIWGHLAAVNDAMLPLMNLGARLHPELDDVFITAPDRTAVKEFTPAEVKKMWIEINEKLSTEIAKLTPSEWLKKHNAVSEEDFKKEPTRNRMAILLSRAGHIGYHLGQAMLLKP
jgi:DinB superfamily